MQDVFLFCFSFVFCFFGIMRELKANFCAQEDKEMQESRVEVICENAL